MNHIILAFQILVLIFGSVLLIRFYRRIKKLDSNETVDTKQLITSLNIFLACVIIEAVLSIIQAVLRFLS